MAVQDRDRPFTIRSRRSGCYPVLPVSAGGLNGRANGVRRVTLREDLTGVSAPFAFSRAAAGPQQYPARQTETAITTATTTTAAPAMRPNFAALGRPDLRIFSTSAYATVVACPVFLSLTSKDASSILLM